ncbi:MAG: dTDP-4-dehydrorhamnose 3,5-epimerase [Alphaproteobacteria bacterium]|nr:dTDP-4-dehydrorhamnose 3,5-epimerase [Alphaproteobacteria bacterium]
MMFTATLLEGAWLIELDRREDERGFFARIWCRRELAAQGLDAEIAQQSLSYNRHRGTVRGLHFQRPPQEETKIVRCTCGGIFDVMVDLRRWSPTYLRWQGFELTAENRKALYVPKGFAHGFQTLADNSEVMYQMSEFYASEAAGGYRFDDAAFGIIWPLPVTVISERDLGWAPVSTSPP